VQTGQGGSEGSMRQLMEGTDPELPVPRNINADSVSIAICHKTMQTEK